MNHRGAGQAISIPTCFLFVFGIASWCCVQDGYADEGVLGKIESILSKDPKPFVIVEASGNGSVVRGQGVVVSAEGHVLTAGHVSWNDSSQSFSDQFRVGFRGNDRDLPKGIVHAHKTVYTDREDAEFFEHSYSAELIRKEDSRFVGNGDLALLTIDAEGAFPTLPFFSEGKPKVRVGEVFHLCHYSFPHKAGSPTLLVNPIEIVGMAQTSSGIQYLAKGYYRVGSSGGAILKDGRLIGIQSSAYTVNAKDVGEIPMGLISFHVVWADLVKGHLQTEEALGDR